MTDKPTYEELEKQIKDLEKEIEDIQLKLNQRVIEEELKYFGIFDTLSEGVVLNEAVYNDKNE